MAIDKEAIWNSVKNLGESELKQPDILIQKEEETPDNGIVLSIVNELKNIHKNGGYLKIARRYSVSMYVVDLIYNAMIKRLYEISVGE